MTNPGFTLVAVLTLALAIGATSTIFSAVNGILIRPLPYPDPARLVMLWGDDPIRDRHRSQVCYPDMEDWRQQSHVFEGVAAFTGYWSPVLSTASGVEQINGARVSDGFFRVMKTQPLLGRTFLPEEQLDGRGDVAILTYGQPASDRRSHPRQGGCVDRWSFSAPIGSRPSSSEHVSRRSRAPPAALKPSRVPEPGKPARRFRSWPRSRPGR
jgi:hypothetical protein